MLKENDKFNIIFNFIFNQNSHSMNRPMIAAFDFDHTLSDRDSLLPFLFFLEGKIKTYAKLIRITPKLIAFALGSISRQQIKEAILVLFLKNYSPAELNKKSKEYAENNLNQFIRPEALEKLRWHQSQAHQCIIISASIENYLKPWAQIHGIDTVIASILVTDDNQKITGYLKGNNCWGKEKVDRLLSTFGPKEKFILYAYGDSRGDKELLELADFPFYRIFY